MPGLAYGGIEIADGASGTVALTTTAALMTGWAQNSLADSNNRAGDPAVVPDYANNRVKLQSPGVYLVTFDISFTTGTTADFVAQLRKNGTILTNNSCRVNVISTSSVRGVMSMTAIVVVSPSDNPKTLASFASPSSTGYAGAGGAPSTEVALDVVLKVLSSTATVTVEAAHLNVVRLDG